LSMKDGLGPNRALCQGNVSDKVDWSALAPCAKVSFLRKLTGQLCFQPGSVPGLVFSES